MPQKKRARAKTGTLKPLYTVCCIPLFAFKNKLQMLKSNRYKEENCDIMQRQTGYTE